MYYPENPYLKKMFPEYHNNRIYDGLLSGLMVKSPRRYYGTAIKFLPGDINGLLDRLKLLYAERRAGNTVSTTDEIVAILDELLRTETITRKQYNNACKELSC